MISKSAFMLIVPMIWSLGAAADVQCVANCSLYAEAILFHQSLPSASEFDDACGSAGGGVRQGDSNAGGSMQCGESRDFYCVTQTTLAAIGVGSEVSEYEARVRAKEDCYGKLPAQDCSAYYWVGTKQLKGAVTCEQK